MSQTFYFPHDAQLVLGSARQKADTNFQILCCSWVDETGLPAEQELLSRHRLGSAVPFMPIFEVADATTSRVRRWPTH
jgi:hypothetical protein